MMGAMPAGPRFAVGVDLGTTYTCAAVSEPPGERARVVQLTGTSQTIPSVVSITDEGVVAGEAAERRLVSHPQTTAREFKRRLGDATPIVLGSETYGAEVLTGHLLGEVLQRVERNEGGSPAVVGLAHPASWGPFRLDLLRDAGRHAGLDEVVLVPEPVAAAVANRDRVEADSRVAVYDLGGGTFDAAVVQMGATAGAEVSVVGTPEGVERLGGIDFDQAIMAHVDSVLDGQVFALDSSDPEARSALMRLRAECQAAKEHLSQDSDADVNVSLPSLQTTVRITRAEFEAMVRPRLADSLAVLDRVVASAGGWEAISSVLLVGGSSNIPAVAQAVSEHTGRPVVTATSPHLAISMGTAMVAAGGLEPAPVAAAPVAAGAATAAARAAGDDASSGSGRPGWLLPVGIVVLVLAAIGGYFAFAGGGDDDEEASVETTAPATTVPGATTVPATTVPGATTVPATDPPTTEPPTTEPPATTTPSTDAPATTAPDVPVVDVAIQECGPADSSILGVVFQSGALVAVGDDGVSNLDGATVDPCSLDLTARIPTGVTLLDSPNGAAAAGDAMAVATPAGGVIVNGSTGNVVQCDLLTGPLTVNSDGVSFPIVDGTVLRLRAEADGCSERDNSTFEGLLATAIAAGSTEQLAVGGTADGAVQLWVYDRVDNRNVVDGFGSVDGVASCNGRWCVIDLTDQLVHVVEIDGTYTGAAPIAGTPLEGVSSILATSPTGNGPAIVSTDTNIITLTAP
ncbi:Hsp70 protein [Ilumatobacter fluminis]|uniref:Hsp70 protein n=2 Tax=Ilumatobacter fluminis TaxID=467091 RepID=A0A4R7HV58_9ACTN|nr:Hsp70 protein [Ilumatobacter fluminis]